MIKRIVIAGCRNYNDYEQAKIFIDNCLREMRKKHTIVIVSGCSKGADSIGERYAIENGFEIEKYPADWKSFGRKAGPVRNEQMAKISDLIICFWDGKSKGTKSMISYAKKYEKNIFIKTI
ncbi:MAG: DUF2493 domain-containing protein [Clostridia bacterium]|nr:DUF2493 domain-containing protein [Clostridia bacterium]